MLKITSLLALTLATTPFLATQIAHAAPAKVANKSASWIALKAQTDKKQYAVGEPIKVKLVATNIQNKDAYLKFSSGQTFDLQLFRAGENEAVYTWSANKSFAQMINHVKLKQGQSETYNAEIGSEMGELKAGKYRLESYLTNSSRIAARPIEFTIAAQKSTLSATTDKSVYAAGEAVKVDFALQNNANTPTTFDLTSGKTYDVFIRNEAGETIWNWSANKRFIMAMRKVTLAAGEKQDFSVTWDGRALPDYQITPGKYTVEAVYAATPEVKAAPVEIEIR